MIRYISTDQLTLPGFSDPFGRTLSKENRWIKLAAVIPWDELASIYAKHLNSHRGRQSVDVRRVLGALIIKHKQGFSDRETVQSIAENVYMQYFCGFSSFSNKVPFDASVFVDIRKRMGQDSFEAFNDQVIQQVERIKSKKKRVRRAAAGSSDKGAVQAGGPSHARGGVPDNALVEEKNSIIGIDQTPQQVTQSTAEETKPSNKGTLKIDATVADQQIRYPTDLGLLSTSRQESERLIDQLYPQTGLAKKPRTYRKNASKSYLAVVKRKKKSKNLIRKAIGKQLRCLKRNLGHIQALLNHIQRKSATPTNIPFLPLNKRDQKIYCVIQEIYRQQEQMYKNKTHRHPDRIVNIYQPYVRPIVRGKDKANVEFGGKISVSECGGMSRVGRISWDAFNESKDLKMQVEQYAKSYGYYPEVVLADRIYQTRENREWLKEHHIRTAGKPLGRPPKEKLSAYQKRKRRKELGQRNLIEGKFGQAKNAYGLSNIRARRQDTSESWISAIFFVMNLVSLAKIAEQAGIFCAFFKMRLIRNLWLEFGNFSPWTRRKNLIPVWAEV